ncbi:MAG TPA: hypothetical protein VFW12_11290 [Candidatus Limnocylindria bacterium]|nr:hypothetical protein [Candidatus Limnocylindria bacterium]
MRHAQALLPYAVTALLVVVTSAAALGLAVADVRDARDAAVDRAAASATIAPRTFPELSRASRLAYWRTDPGGGADLTVANLDGTLRRTLARAEAIRRISLTRWTPDGSAIAYVDNGNVLTVARLDGTRTDIPLGDEIRTQGGRIVDHRWSPDSESIAASVVRADLRSDVYFAKASERTWTRATTLEDAFAADWIAADQVLVHTGGGVLGTMRPGAQLNAIRPLTGLPATSPILADDGRIHFLTGAITSTPRDITLPYLTASGATVWSMSPDGSDLRRETQNVMDDVRLDGRYGQGRYLAHRGSSQLQVLLSEGVNIPAIDAGPVERAIVAPDGRSAIGFSASRIIRFDLVRGAALGTFVSPTVMLDSVAGGDVWYPRTAPAALPEAAPAGARPTARYVFSLGGHLWSMGPDGAASFLRARTSLAGRRNVLPTWSPRGDRLLAIQLAGQGLAGVTAATPVATTIDRDGTVRPYAESRAATAIPSWSPDGDAFAVVVDRRGVDATSSQAELEVRFVRVDGGLAREAVPGREAVWTRAGVLVLTTTSVDLVDGGSRRTLVELARILADPRGEFPADRTSTSFANLSSSPDGAYAAVRVGVTPRLGANRFTVVLVRVADGAVTAFLNGSTAQDLGWSPAGGRLGLTQTAEGGTLAQVRDAATGQVIASQPGRFAGWSPDGGWSYVARGEGLFAYRAGSPEAVRVSAIGVPVMTTAP